MPIERYKPDFTQVSEELLAQRDTGVISIGEAVPMMPTKRRDLGDKDYGHIPMSQDDYTQLKKIIVDQDIASQCLPLYFDDEVEAVRISKAEMVNIYHEHEGNWNEMKKDHRAVSYSSLNRYWQDPKFRACIMALDEMFSVEAESEIKSLMRHSGDERVRLEAARSWLRAKKPEEWNPAVQKQIVANKGSLATTFFKQLVSQEEFTKTLASDPFSPLPLEAQKLLKESIGMSDNTAPLTALLPESPPEVISPTMPIDPFGLEYNLEED